MNDITVQFRGVLALHKVQYDAKPGKVHVLFGKNGAGKPTIVKVLAGVNTNYKGEIYYHNVFACLAAANYTGRVGFELMPLTTTAGAAKAIISY